MTTLALAPNTQTFKLDDPKRHPNPWPAYAQLRKDRPIVRVNFPMLGSGWLVSRYNDVVMVLKDARFSNNSRQYTRSLVNARWLPNIMRAIQDSMINADDPDHARLRNLVHQAFTPRRVEALTTQVEQITERLLDAVVAQGQADLMTAFALPLPLTVISELLGVSVADRQKFHHWLAQVSEAPSKGLLNLVLSLPTALQMQNFFRRLIQERRTAPQDDLISALVQAEHAGDHLSEDELVAMIFLLLFAGHETTVNLIGNGTLALLEHPHQLQLLRQRPELAERAVEELLRFTNPVEVGTGRYARETLEIQGVTLTPGTMVMPLLASANRDEAVFERADELDLMRHPNRHVAFGNGIHYCLGAPLARLEGQIAFRALTQRFPNLRLAVPRDQVRWRGTLGLRGLKALPLHFA